MEVIYFFIRLIKTVFIHSAVIFTVFNLVEYLSKIIQEKFHWDKDIVSEYSGILAVVIIIIYLSVSLKNKLKTNDKS